MKPTGKKVSTRLLLFLAEVALIVITLVLIGLIWLPAYIARPGN